MVGYLRVLAAVIVAAVVCLATFETCEAGGFVVARRPAAAIAFPRVAVARAVFPQQFVVSHGFAARQVFVPQRVIVPSAFGFNSFGVQSLGVQPLGVHYGGFGVQSFGVRGFGGCGAVLVP